MPAHPDHLIEAARRGDRAALARLLSMVERADDEALAVLASMFPLGGSGYVVGLTGPPGAGKSTLADCLIAAARAEGEVAVLAVDPSSPFTGGAILGDRIRMQRHVDDRGVFIRSMANRGHLGGISVATPRAVAVLDAVGFPFILVETVGVGQAEVEIAERVDTTIVVVNPGWGDSIQAAKAGLLEIGDVFVVNKADQAGVGGTVADLRQMLEMGGKRSWDPPIITTTATSCDGVSEVWQAVRDHRRHLVSAGLLEEQRRHRLAADLQAAVAGELRRRARDAGGDAAYRRIAAEVAARRIDPWSAARRIVDEAT